METIKPFMATESYRRGPTTPHWAVWYDGYNFHGADQHPWGGHGWACDGYMGHLQLAHFVPVQHQNAAHWRLEEGDFGFGEAQGLPMDSLEKHWQPTDWNGQMEKDFQEMVNLYDQLESGEDETEEPGTPTIDTNAEVYSSSDNDGD